MPRFIYKAARVSGEIVQGEMEATTARAVIEHLQENDLLPIHAAERKHSDPGYTLLKRTFSRRRISLRTRVEFTRSMATMLDAGISLDHALDVLSHGTQDERLEVLISQLRSVVLGGDTLAEAVIRQTDAFPPFYAGMVRAAETSGSLALTLHRLADYEERILDVTESLRSALTYPILLVFVSIASLFILLTYVIPNFEPLFAEMGSNLPGSTRIVIAVARFLEAYWWLLIIAMASGLLGVRYALDRPRSRAVIDRRVLDLPLFGDLICKVETARFTRALGTLLQHGVPILAALGIVRDALQNTTIKNAVTSISEALEEGRSITEPVARSGRFPDLVTQFLQVGEETGQLDSMLLKLADIYDDEVDRSVKRLVTLLEPSLILGMGVIIGFIIISVLLAILGLNEFAA